MSGEAVPLRADRRLLMQCAPLIAAVVVGLCAFWLRTRLPVTAATLLPASAFRTRPIEARVSGLPWAPLSRTELKPDDGGTRGGSDARRRQEAGLIELLAGDPRNAVAALEKAAVANQAGVWSDLAAAYYEVAIRHDAPDFLANALATADRALALEPDRAEALFNRALILERLGLRFDAHVAWSRYVAVDGDRGWSGEARQHLDSLTPPPPFLEMLDADYDRIARDPEAAAAIYARDAFGARGQGVVEVLGRWGHATIRGDARDAERHLNVARHLGHAVARGGDRTLEHAVAAIDRAGDGGNALATAHAEFHTGMKTYQKSRPDQAEPLLRRAAATFRQLGSPIAFPALHWAANCRYERGHRDEAEKQIEQLLASTPADYPAYRAFMLWQLANCRDARGEWGAAIELYERAAALFESIGERGNVANVRGILASIYDTIGDAETAWTNRLAALSDDGIRSTETDERIVWSVVEAAVIRRDWHIGASFLNVYVEIVRRLENDVELANALLLRAVVRDQLDNAPGVRDDLAEARHVAARVGDAAYREMLRAAEWRSLAMMRSTPPATADALLTRAIEYGSTVGHRSTLPGLFLLRARARRRAEDVSGALRDVERGIAQMETHRESLAPGAARWGAFQAAEELFEEGVDLAMLANDPEAAFRTTEKARARSLLEAYGVTPDLDLRELPPRTVVVEYVTLPASVVIFTVDAGGVRAARVSVARETLANDIAELWRALQEDDSATANDRAAAIHRQLVEPIDSWLAGAATVVFVPDDVTTTIPFAALMNARGEMLLQRHAIVVAPSAAAFVAASGRRRNVAPRSALIVTASSPTADGASLQFVDAEARRILRKYPAAARIDEGSSQFEELIARGPLSDVIHFGGHAVGDRRGYEPASIVLRDAGVERRIRVAEMAKLRLDRTAVVVLAGCGTARGQRRAAEGVISVAHGFLSAGVPSAVATLWPIGDKEAAVFFPRLHEKLAAGHAPAEALRAVQLDAIRRGDVPASMWAAVQVIGS